jgi:hypothetical protein
MDQYGIWSASDTTMTTNRVLKGILGLKNLRNDTFQPPVALGFESLFSNGSSTV